MRVSPPDDERELPGPQASISVTRAPRSIRWSAVHPPKAPAPMTATWGLDFIWVVGEDFEDTLVVEGIKEQSRLRLCRTGAERDPSLP